MPEVKKVALNKKALFKFLAQDKEGNYIPTQARRKKRMTDGVIVEDLTDGNFDKLLKEDPNRAVHRYTEPESGAIVEQIITSEINDMIVYKGIIFYKSSATSGSETGDTNRLNTWIPSLGLDDKSSHGLGSVGSTFKITKLDKYYDKKFSKPDERIKKYEGYLGNDLMMRLNNFDIMLMSAEIGGGFWDTAQGKSLIHKLSGEGLIIKVGVVSISPKSQLEFDIPFEVKEEDNDLIETLTKKSNSFFEEQGGYLHKGLVLGAKPVSQRPDVYQEICDRARKATCEYRNYPASYKELTIGQPTKEAFTSLFKDYYENTFLRGHWNRHHKDEAKAIVQFINDPTKSVDDIRSHLNKVIQDLAKDPSMASKNLDNSSFLRRVNFALDLTNPYVPTKVESFMKAKDAMNAHKNQIDDSNSSLSP